MNSPHDSWSRVYDETYQRSFGELYKLMTVATLNCIKGISPPPARVIDFGAGTGRLSIPLALAGYDVVASDPSTGMLAVLNAKANTAGAAIRTSLGRMQDAVDGGPFDIAICVFTVLGYVLDEGDLVASFRRAADLLGADGQLLFDVPSPALFKPRRYSEPGFTRAVQITPEGNGVHLYKDHICFRRGDEWDEYEDIFRIRQWTPLEVRDALGLAHLEIREDLSDQFQGTGSSYYRASKCK